MMQTVTTTRMSLTAPQQDLTPDLITEFVKWVDRSEKTTRTYIINLRQFVAWLRYAEITRPTREDILSYREYLTAEHEAIQICGNTWQYRTDSNGNRIKIICKPNTVALYMRSVCQLFKWLASIGFYQTDITENIRAPKIKHDTHRKKALTPEQVQTIEESITSNAAADLTAAEASQKDTAGKMQRSTEQGKRLYAMYMLTVTAGLRTIELARANIKDLEEENGNYTLYIWGKGHTEPDQKKAIAPEVGAAIKEYLQSRTDNYTSNSPLFVATGNRSGGKRLAETTISTMLKKAMQAAGFNSDRLTAHSLRHTAGTNTMQLTGDLYQTQQYMRHSNPATTEIYLHINHDKQDKEIAQRLYNRYHGIETQSDSREQLQEAVSRMTPEQLQQLADIAKAMSR